MEGGSKFLVQKWSMAHKTYITKTLVDSKLAACCIMGFVNTGQVGKLFGSIHV